MVMTHMHANKKLWTDRATRYVSRNISVDCCTTVGRHFTTSPQKIKAMELKHYGRQPVVNCVRVQPRRVDRRKCGQQARPSTSFVDNFVDNTIDISSKNFLSPEFGV